MKKSRILNKKLNTAIADMGHSDMLIICDAGFPIPDEAQRVDLAIEKDLPTVEQVLRLVLEDFIYEKVIVANEQKLYNPLLFERVCALCDRCEVETIPHEEIMAKMPGAAKYIVRTGGFDPWGNVVLISGVDAHRWFDKPGVITPDYYKKRASYDK